MQSAPGYLGAEAPKLIFRPFCSATKWTRRRGGGTLLWLGMEQSQNKPAVSEYTAGLFGFNLDMFQSIVDALINKLASAQIAFGCKFVNEAQFFFGHTNGDRVAVRSFRHERVDWCRPLSLDNIVSDNVIF